MIPFEWFGAARRRISPHIMKTPLTYDAERGLFLKWENHQITGSFKARGALNKVLSLEEWEREAGLVAASAGNHGQGVALAGRLTGTTVDVFAPAHAVKSKVQAMKGLGAIVHFIEGGYAEAESAAKVHAADQHKTYVSPYNDAQVIAGQGTMAMEILDQLPELPGQAGAPDAAPPEIADWIVPTGGGGLICACGVVLAAQNPRPKLLGVQPEASAFTHSLFHRRTQVGVHDGPTLADGLSGAIDPDSITIPMLRQYVDEMLVVSEEEISEAIAFAWHAYHERIEGSAAVSLAASLGPAAEARPSVVIISGGNIEDEVFESVTRAHAVPRWM